MLGIAAVSLLLATIGVDSHATYYPEVDLESYATKGEYPPFRSYHIHDLFVAYNKDSEASALALRTKFMEKFELTSEKPCEGLFHQGRLCMFEISYHNTPGSPFVSANWAVFVPLEWFHICVPWIMQNRGDEDILVHPNSGAMLNDHKRWPVWGGNPWPINFSIFTNQTHFID